MNKGVLKSVFVRGILSGAGAMMFAAAIFFALPLRAAHDYNGPYTGRNLDRVAFPIGGIGAGMFCLEGTGAISHLSVRNQLDFFKEPPCFATLCVLGETPDQNIARVIEGTIPDWKFFGRPNSGNGAPGATYGLPRFRECSFRFRFPFAEIDLADAALPVDVKIIGWSPFTPGDPDSSSYPVGGMEYVVTNRSEKEQNVIFSFNSPNFMNGGGSIGPMDDGFVLFDQTGPDRENRGGFAFFLRGADANGKSLRLDDVLVDHCWFRGGWWDAFTIAWDNVQQGRRIKNPPQASHAPGATISVPVTLMPGESKTIRLLSAWYAPQTDIAAGTAASRGFVFEKGPSRGTGRGQQPVTGFLGKGFVNTFDPHGDGGTGRLMSPPITLNKKFIHFLVGGGESCAVKLNVDGKTYRRLSGDNAETLRWVSWDVSEFSGKTGTIRIVDDQTGGWGHLNVDHFVMSDEPIEVLRTGSGNQIVADPGRVTLIADFEAGDFSPWIAEEISPSPDASEPVSGCEPGSPCCPEGKIPTTYIPWYARTCRSIYDVTNLWTDRYDELRERSDLFAKTFYDSTLPPEVVEAVAANLSILKSPTVLRQCDGRLWCWEGCSDTSGCCAGSCTHVWNYAQAICHLFPSLERSLRQTEFFDSTDASGRQAFRANLPIRPGGITFDASDGQLGGIMKLYREWRISGDKAWLAKLFPQAVLSMNYMIKTYDPRHTGLLEEDHHNTYDINYFGPEGHCGSFYLGALAAMLDMAAALGDEASNAANAKVKLYRELLDKGKSRMVRELFNGEYFIQIVQKEGLARNFAPIDPQQQGNGYRAIAEEVNRQGPKYQYGTGCLSDGVLGFWIARTAGLDAEILPDDMVRHHLLSVYRNNFRSDLSSHANPQRPSYAMGDDAGLLLCTWPHGGKPLLPFVYSDEVWTGIEYQVASHLMMLGCVNEGLDIVRAVRTRHDGVRRNPLNEYECGHWYARAMASYGLLQGLTGVRYDGVSQTLYVDSMVGDFRSFLATEDGFGTVVFREGKVTVETASGNIPVQNIVVAPRR